LTRENDLKNGLTGSTKKDRHYTEENTDNCCGALCALRLFLKFKNIALSRY